MYREYAHPALIVTSIGNALRGKNQRPYQVEDFIPAELVRSLKSMAPAQSSKDMLNTFKSIVRPRKRG